MKIPAGSSPPDMVTPPASAGQQSPLYTEQEHDHQRPAHRHRHHRPHVPARSLPTPRGLQPRPRRSPTTPQNLQAGHEEGEDIGYMPMTMEEAAGALRAASAQPAGSDTQHDQGHRDQHQGGGGGQQRGSAARRAAAPAADAADGPRHLRRPKGEAGESSGRSADPSLHTRPDRTAATLQAQRTAATRRSGDAALAQAFPGANLLFARDDRTATAAQLNAALADYVSAVQRRSRELGSARVTPIQLQLAGIRAYLTHPALPLSNPQAPIVSSEAVRLSDVKSELTARLPTPSAQPQPQPQDLSLAEQDRYALLPLMLLSARQRRLPSAHSAAVARLDVVAAIDAHRRSS